MPFLKNYKELNKYIADHQGQQVVVRIRRKDEISKLAGRFEIQVKKSFLSLFYTVHFEIGISRITGKHLSEPYPTFRYSRS